MLDLALGELERSHTTLHMDLIKNYPHAIPHKVVVVKILVYNSHIILLLDTNKNRIWGYLLASIRFGLP